MLRNVELLLTTFKQNKALMNSALPKVYMVLFAILQPLKQPLS